MDLAAELATAVAPTTLARQRTLPVAAALRPLLPDGALTRGRTVACRGPAATSLAVALAAAAADAGAWLAVVDVPWLGVEAVAELGVPLERLVRIDLGERTGSYGAGWADLVAAVLDGFELVVTRVPPRLNAVVLRRVLARVQAREAVLVAVGEPGALTPDIASRPRRRCGRAWPTGRDICVDGGSRSRLPGGGSPPLAEPSCGCPARVVASPVSRSRPVSVRWDDGRPV